MKTILAALAILGMLVAGSGTVAAHQSHHYGHYSHGHDYWRYRAYDGWDWAPCSWDMALQSAIFLAR